MMMLCLLLLPSSAAARPWHEGYSFEMYKAEFGKRYSGAHEERQRRRIFEARTATIAAHNRAAHSWKMGINALTDLTENERAARLGRRKITLPQNAPRRGGSGGARPASLDWRDEGVVTAVKDQGNCGSCWAFASTESVESYVALATGELPVLSAQQLVSCAANPYDCGGSGGCGGSIPELAFNYVQLYGQATEWTYPYASYAGDTSGNCTAASAAVSIDGYEKVDVNDYDAVLDALVNVGPLAVNVDASLWHDYESGVFDACSNSSLDLNHVVQLVGYGRDDDLGADYWLVRNSWDVSFGEEGYIRLYRDDDDGPACALDTTPLDGTGCVGGNATQHVCGECGLLFDVSFPVGARSLS
ncbi:hypothetical protein CTAYLR_002866 [Chrysophaeum taylorii]|uniref:Uncharacterized protein n=1 Tax=Chrysophaeum taylorii TaxID=2483200 RepID=A0AAD7XJ19_9STRA|nr:hypothetical protein CTAYLR_002866 [Chrysophaeum taylorii]